MTSSLPSPPTSNTMISILNGEDEKQYKLLKSVSAEVDAGQIRFAAAMYFYNRSMINAKALEIFRGLAKEPSTDPRTVLEKAECLDQIELETTETRK